MMTLFSAVVVELCNYRELIILFGLFVRLLLNRNSLNLFAPRNCLHLIAFLFVLITKVVSFSLFEALQSVEIQNFRNRLIKICLTQN
jgi:hypothetical protein